MIILKGQVTQTCTHYTKQKNEKRLAEKEKQKKANIPVLNNGKI